MYITINSITLYKENEVEGFCSKLINIKDFNCSRIVPGTIITIANGDKYEVIRILYVSMIGKDIGIEVKPKKILKEKKRGLTGSYCINEGNDVYIEQEQD